MQAVVHQVYLLVVVVLVVLAEQVFQAVVEELFIQQEH
jgi:hypothetical protein